MGEFDMSVHHLEDKTKRNQESVGVWLALTNVF